MEKLYFVICGKYWKFGKLKILYLAEKIFQEEQTTEISKILGLI